MKKAFTLIELMTVVAIIVIVVTVALVMLFGARRKSKVVAYKSEVRSIQTAAVSTCDSADLTVVNVTKPQGSLYVGNISVSPFQSCGVAILGLFSVTVQSIGTGVDACDNENTILNQDGVQFPLGC